MTHHTIPDVVEAFFKQENWKFERFDDWFESNIMLHEDVRAMIQISTGEDGLVIMTALDSTVPEEAGNVVMTFMNAMNMSLPMGCLYLDTNEMLPVFRLGNLFGKALPDEEEIAERIYLCLDILDRTAGVLNGLVGHNMTVEEAVASVLEEDAES